MNNENSRHIGSRIVRSETLLLVLDRFEEEYAVCQDIETEKLLHFAIDRLPCSAQVNDVLQLTDGILTINTAETLKRKRELNALMEELWD